MASIVTAANVLNGVGEFLKLPESDRKALFPREDRVKGFTAAIAPYNTAAWEEAVNDFRDIHRLDITGTLATKTETIIKAAVCNLIVSLMWEQNINHPKDLASIKAKKHRGRYQKIVGRTRTFSASGRNANIGQSNRMVRA